MARPTTVNGKQHSYYYEVLDALTGPGCGVCALVTRARIRYLDGLAYESVNDIAIREKLRKALGLCNRHAWFFLNDVREPLGTAIIYRDILRTLYRATANGNAPRAIVSVGPCLACTIERVVADNALFTIVDSLDSIELIEALQQSIGLCAPHLVRACQLAPPRTGQRLLEIVQQSWTRRMVTLHASLAMLATGAPGTFPKDQPTVPMIESTTKIGLPATDDPYTCPVCAYVNVNLLNVDPSHLTDKPSGLCNVHAWALPTDGFTSLLQQTHQIYLNQARLLVNRPDRGTIVEKARLFWRTRHPPLLVRAPVACVVCARQAAIEAQCGQEDHQLLCLPHLRQAVAAANANVLPRIRPSWLSLSELLGEYIRKEDYRFRHEPRGSERDSPRWATALVAGAPGLA